MDDRLRSEFEKLGEEWSEAIVSNDAGSIAHFMTDDWVIIGETGISKKDDFLALVASGDLTHEMMEGDVKMVRIYGAIAIIVARGVNSAHYKGQPFNSDEWITDVFTRREGRWQCVLTHPTPAVDRI